MQKTIHILTTIKNGRGKIIANQNDKVTLISVSLPALIVKGKDTFSVRVEETDYLTLKQ
jgi:hypothetical protein